MFRRPAGEGREVINFPFPALLRIPFPPSPPAFPEDTTPSPATHIFPHKYMPARQSPFDTILESHSAAPVPLVSHVAL